MSITAIESVEKIVSENFNDSTIQSLFARSGQSKERFVAEFAAILIKLQGFELNLQTYNIVPIQRSFSIQGIAKVDVLTDQDGTRYSVTVDIYIGPCHFGYAS